MWMGKNRGREDEDLELGKRDFFRVWAVLEL